MNGLDFWILTFYCDFIGIYEATSLERGKRDNAHSADLADEIFEDQNQKSPLPTWSICDSHVC